MPKSMHLTSGGMQDTSIHYALSKKSNEEKEKIVKKLKETKCDFYGGE